MHSIGASLHSFYRTFRTAIACARQWLSGHVLAGILLLGLAVGAACIAIVPPWWHYDEPGHFEYAWLVAHSPTWPKPEQYSQGMRKQMATSMLRYGWYRIRNFRPNINSNAPIPIGVTQTGDQPGYYFLASLPLRLMVNADITAQYFAARLVSFILFLLIIVVAWYAFGEILPGGNALRWMATVFVAVLPAFVDTMVSVNNDVSAVLAASLAIWACLRLIQKGYSVRRLLFLAASLAACYLSKSIALFTFALAPLALILAPLRGRYTRPVWGALVLALLVLAALALTGGAPRSWYSPAGSSSMRTAQQGAPLGSHVFQLDDSRPGAVSQLMQNITPEQLKDVKRQVVTLGAWVWADQPTQAGPFYVEFVTRANAIIDSPRTVLEVTSKPEFRRFTFNVPGNAVSAAIYVQQTGHGLPNNHVFVDGIVLAPGSFTGTPDFADAGGARGTWDSRTFTNLVRNPSAEADALQIRRSVDLATAVPLSKAGISLDATLAMIQDGGGTGWYYRGAVTTLFRTFWDSLAGDKAVVPSTTISYFLFLLTAAALVGAILRLWTRRATVRWDIVGFLAVALVLPWLLALTRGSADVLRGSALYPWARYAFPAILPSALLICAGWLEWLERLSLQFKLRPVARDAVFFGFMLGLCFLALVNAVFFFHPGWWDNVVLLVLLLLFQAAFLYLYHRSSPRAAAPPAAPGA
jgi:hypothetical protein